MPTRRRAALALALACLSGEPALAATCNLTVVGARILDDATCSVVQRGGVIQVAVENGDVVTVRGSTMSARIASLAPVGPRRRGVHAALGRVVASDPTDGKTCYFGQKAVLCVEP